MLSPAAARASCRLALSATASSSRSQILPYPASSYLATTSIFQQSCSYKTGRRENTGIPTRGGNRKDKKAKARQPSQFKKLDRDDRPAFRSFDDKPFQFKGFPEPNRIPLDQALRMARKHLQFYRHPHNEFPERLVSYGVKDPVVQYLLKTTLARAPEPKRAKEHFKNVQASNTYRLVKKWVDQALRILDEQDISNLQPVALTPTMNAIDRVAALPMLISEAYPTEGKECLPRITTSLILDWIQQGIRGLVSNPQEFNLPQAASIELSSLHSQLTLLRGCTDLRLPAFNYPIARTLTRQIHIHVGPTNSGKTHGALVALSKARTGVFAGPLRLLAHEVWERFNEGTISPGVPPRACNLLTGEEQRVVDPMAGLQACTVEMVNLSRAVDVAVIDEIQMIGDSQRGYAWTAAVLGVPAKEIHLCGEASAVDLVKRLAEACGDEVHVHHYQRLTPLHVSESSLNGDLSQIRQGDCIVAFSRSGIFHLKREIEQKTGLRCAVAYGALPPETKSEQAKLFNEGKLDVMVASDAIGMGLNLKIKRIIFHKVTKWDGRDIVVLSPSQIKQIAGRAGRFGTKRDANEPDGGLVTTLDEDGIEVLRAALAHPIVPVDKAAIQPSSDALASMTALLPPTVAYENADKRTEEPRTLSHIYKDVSMLAQIDHSSYYLSDFSQQHALSPVVEQASRSLLTISERETFANAPANTRDERVKTFLANCVRRFASGGLVHFDACAQELGMLEHEELVVSAIKQAEEARDAKGASALAPGEPLASHLEHTHPLFDASALMMLESLHRSFSLYLWLSYRFPLAFCFRQEVDDRKKIVEDGIEFCLEGIRFGRASRLRALGRTEEAENVFKKPSWRSKPVPRTESSSSGSDSVFRD